MTLRRIHIYTKNALLIVFAMIVMAGATGLSYTAHYCHDRLSGVAFYTELGIQKEASCGCKEDAVIANSHSSTTEPLTFSKKSCCANISFSGKLNFETSVDYSSIALFQPAITPLPSNVSLQFISEEENIPVSDAESPPPPIAGRKLVLFLSQQRIPLIIYNS
ncbi:MAG: hypothetical protein WCI92_02315 [Bacteroidota bacterium]